MALLVIKDVGSYGTITRFHTTYIQLKDMFFRWFLSVPLEPYIGSCTLYDVLRTPTAMCVPPARFVQSADPSGRRRVRISYSYLIYDIYELNTSVKPREQCQPCPRAPGVG